MASPITNIVKWSVVPQKGQATFYNDMNTWLSETNTVVNSWNGSITQTNNVYADINIIYNAIQNQAVSGGYSQVYIDRALIAAYVEYTATGGETSTLTADNTNLQILKDGVLQVETTDYDLNADNVTIDWVAPLTVGNFIQWYDLNKLNNSFYKKSEIDSFTVKLTGNQTISGIKTFSSSPIVPTPTTGQQVTNKDYVDNLLNATITGTATFTNVDNNIEMTGIGSLGLEIGDVISIADSVSNNKIFTVEVLTNADNIIVNKAHAGGTTTKSLVDEAATADVVVTLLSKWYNASIGLGRGIVIMTAARALDVTYANNLKREMKVIVTNKTNVTTDPVYLEMKINGIAVLESDHGSDSGQSDRSAGTIIVPEGDDYLATSGGVGILLTWAELR